MKSQNLYSSKQIWKIILSIIALLIIGVSLWYNNHLARKIQEEERLRVKLWSETVKKQAQLINLTNETFDQLKAEERENINDWALALKETQRDQNDYTFVSHFLSKTRNTPIITETVSLKDGRRTSNFASDLISFSGKTPKEQQRLEDSLKIVCHNWDSISEPIEVKSSLSSYYQILHIGVSKLYGELKNKRDSLINSFENQLISNSASIPILYIDSVSGKIKRTINVDPESIKDSTSIVATLAQMEKENDKIKISFSENETGFIYYSESSLLKQLRSYPWIQLIIIFLFLMVSYFLFSTFRKAEQNQVWAGMAKETAHQLGTPLSSLMAWLEIIKADGVPESSIEEMNKDINRLNTITDRFSKIGSTVKAKEENIYQSVEHSVNYLRARVSKQVDLELQGDKNAVAHINSSLFEWVIENLTKNAIDAIQGKKGSVTYTIEDIGNKVILDVTDTGKGMPASNFKSIFNPGFSTKERGWGLGLSLVKRIVEEQLKGKIYVLNSKIDQGTTFRIVLKK